MNVSEVPPELSGDEVMADAMNELGGISLYGSDGGVDSQLNEEMQDSLESIENSSFGDLLLPVGTSNPFGVSGSNELPLPVDRVPPGMNCNEGLINALESDGTGLIPPMEGDLSSCGTELQLPMEKGLSNMSDGVGLIQAKESDSLDISDGNRLQFPMQDVPSDVSDISHLQMPVVKSPSGVTDGKGPQLRGEGISSGLSDSREMTRPIESDPSDVSDGQVLQLLMQNISPDLSEGKGLQLPEDRVSVDIHAMECYPLGGNESTELQLPEDKGLSNVSSGKGLQLPVERIPLSVNDSRELNHNILSDPASVKQSEDLQLPMEDIPSVVSDRSEIIHPLGSDSSDVSECKVLQLPKDTGLSDMINGNVLVNTIESDGTGLNLLEDKGPSSVSNSEVEVVLPSVSDGSRLHLENDPSDVNESEGLQLPVEGIPSGISDGTRSQLLEDNDPSGVNKNEGPQLPVEGIPPSVSDGTKSQLFEDEDPSGVKSEGLQLPVESIPSGINDGTRSQLLEDNDPSGVNKNEGPQLPGEGIPSGVGIQMDPSDKSDGTGLQLPEDKSPLHICRSEGLQLPAVEGTSGIIDELPHPKECDNADIIGSHELKLAKEKDPSVLIHGMETNSSDVSDDRPLQLPESNGLSCITDGEILPAINDPSSISDAESVPSGVSGSNDLQMSLEKGSPDVNDDPMEIDPSGDSHGLQLPVENFPLGMSEDEGSILAMEIDPSGVNAGKELKLHVKDIPLGESDDRAVIHSLESDLSDASDGKILKLSDENSSSSVSDGKGLSMQAGNGPWNKGSIHPLESNSPGVTDDGLQLSVKDGVDDSRTVDHPVECGPSGVSEGSLPPVKNDCEGLQLPGNSDSLDTGDVEGLQILRESDPSNTSDGAPLAALVSVTSIDPAIFEKQGNEQDLSNERDIAAEDSSDSDVPKAITVETKTVDCANLDNHQVSKSDPVIGGADGLQGLRASVDPEENITESLLPVISQTETSTGEKGPVVHDSQEFEKSATVIEGVPEQLPDVSDILNKNTMLPELENCDLLGEDLSQESEIGPLTTKLEPDDSEFQENLLQDTMSNIEESLHQEERLDLVDETVSNLSVCSGNVSQDRTGKGIICPDLIDDQEQLENITNELQESSTVGNLDEFDEEEPEELLNDMVFEEEMEVKPRIISEGRVEPPVLRSGQKKNTKKVFPRKDLFTSNAGIVEESVRFVSTPDSTPNDIDLEEQFIDPLDCMDMEGDDEDEADATGTSIDPLYCSDEELLPGEVLGSAPSFAERSNSLGETPSETTVSVTSLRTRIRERPYKCTKCNQRFSLPSALTLHLGSHTGEDPYACEECGRTFSVYSRLVNHRKTHEVGNKCYECGLNFADGSALQTHICMPDLGSDELHPCDECGAIFDDVSKLDRHIASHVAVDKYTCGECGENFTNRPALLKHNKSHRPYKCTYCRLSFKEQGKLRAHIKTHAGPYKCSFCGKTFPERYRLVRHEKTHVRLKELGVPHVTGTSPYKVTQSSASNIEQQPRGESLKIRFTKVKHDCDKCGQNFPTASELESHLNTHKNVFQCGECKETFNRHTLLMKHFNAVHSKKFKCGECREGFSTSAELTEHQSMHEIEKKPHRCNNCGERFADRSDLIEHLVKHNEELGFKEEPSAPSPTKTPAMKGLSSPPMVMIPYSNKTDVLPQVEKQENAARIYKGKRHPCVECDKTFSKRILLVKHMRMHAREKKEKCAECNERFKDRDGLVRHIRLIHTRHDPPYNCQLCPRSYPERHRYNRHLKTHLGNMPFKCDQCDKVFPEKYLLGIHYRTHTGERPFKCTECDRSFSMRSYLNSHIQMYHSGGKSYKCHVCGLRYDLHSALIAHLKMHANKKVSVKSPDVSNESESQDKSILESLLQTEQKSEKKPQSKYAYPCKLCNGGFNHYSNLSRHMKTVHKCKMDGTPKVNIDTLPVVLLEKIDTPKQNTTEVPNVPEVKEATSVDLYSPSQDLLTCTVCFKAFSSVGNMYRHVRTVHKIKVVPQTPPQIPPQIPAAPPRAIATPRKVPTAPHRVPAAPPRVPATPPRVPATPPRVPVAPPRVPATPPRVLPSPVVDTRPVDSQPEKGGYIHKCPECGKLFNARSYLVRHLNRHAALKLMHFKMLSGSKEPIISRSAKGKTGSYKCPKCPKLYTEKCNLNRHFKNAHVGETLVIAEESEENKSDSNSLVSVPNLDGMYECPECGKSFHYSNNLRKHLQMHKSAMQFTNSSDRSKPELSDASDTSDVHVSPGIVEETPYKCKKCGKGFGFISSYKRHLKTHTQTMLSIPLHGNIPDNVDYNASSEIVPPHCDLCNRDFQFVADLNRHMKMKHRAGIDVDGSSLPLLERESSTGPHSSEISRDTPPDIVGTDNVEHGPFACKICGKKFEMKAQLNGHSSTHLFMCKYCSKRFVNKFQLSRHLKTYKHNRLLPYECTFVKCKKKFSNAAALNVHMMVHTTVKQEPEENAVPGERKITFPTMAELHARRKIRNAMHMYRCELCGKHFPNSFKLNRHLNTKKHARPMMNPRMYSNSFNRDVLSVQKPSHIQNKPIDNNITLLDSGKAINVEESDYQQVSKQNSPQFKDKPILFTCKMCNVGFVHESVYRRHMNTKRHFHLLSQECKICSKRFVDVGSLKTHLATHSSEKAMVQREGDREFHYTSSLSEGDGNRPSQVDDEVLVVDEEEGDSNWSQVPNPSVRSQQSFNCEECGKRFFDRIKFNRHIKTHLMEKRFKCKLCGLAFYDSAKLKRHMQTQKHTTKWPHRCKDCGDVFANSNKLYRHTRIAHGEAISCHLCGKRFVDNYNLNRHLRTQKHNVSLPHTCSICRKCFTSQSKLRFHSLKMHGVNLPLLSSDHQNEDSRESNFTVSEGTGESADVEDQFLDSEMMVEQGDDDDEEEEEEGLGDTLLRFGVQQQEYRGEQEQSSLKQQQQQQQQQWDNVGGHHLQSFGDDNSQTSRHARLHPDFPFICTICGKGFYFQGKLNGHMKTHSKVTRPAKPNPKPKKLFQCPECGLGYNNEVWLQKHITSHFDTRANILEEVPNTDEIQIDTIKEEPLEID